MTGRTYTPRITPPGEASHDFRDFLRLLRRRGWIILVCLVVLPVGTYLYTAGRPKVFQATTVIIPQSTASSAALPPQFQPPQTNVDAVAGFVSTSAVANEAARRLGLPPGSLLGAATATADDTTGFITIAATGPTQKRAVDTANAFAAALDTTQRQSNQERIQQALESVQQQLANTRKNDPNRPQLLSQLQSIQTLKRAQSENVQVLQPAIGAAQIAPHPKRNATLALLLALLIGIGLVLLAERMDRRLRKPEDLERLTDVPFLGTIPRDAFVEVQPDRDVTEAFQTLRNSLAYLNVDEPFRTLAVTSALKGEGKTTVALHLAHAYAKFGKRVVLLDTDLRKPDLASRTGLAERPGLSDVLAGEATLDDALQEIAPFGAGLRLLAAGGAPGNAPALLASMRMSALISELSSDADMLIVDTAPLLIVSDTFPLLDKVSGIVAVARLNQTPRDAIRRMLQISDSAGGRVAGIVVTGAGQGALTGYGYGYGYGSRYGRDDGEVTVDGAVLRPGG